MLRQTLCRRYSFVDTECFTTKDLIMIESFKFLMCNGQQPQHFTANDRVFQHMISLTRYIVAALLRFYLGTDGLGGVSIVLLEAVGVGRLGTLGRPLVGSGFGGALLVGRFGLLGTPLGLGGGGSGTLS